MANANKALKDLIEEGKESGVLSLEDLNRSMAEADLSAEDSDDIRDALSEEGVQILDQKKFKEISSDKDAPRTKHCLQVAFCRRQSRRYQGAIGHTRKGSQQTALTARSCTRRDI